MKITRFNNIVAQKRGTTLTKAAAYELTEDNILQDGNFLIKVNSSAKLTLPAASDDLHGVSLLITTTSQGQVYVAAGFGGGGAAYDTVTIGNYETIEFYCDGSYWYAITSDIESTGSSSSSSSSSLSSSSSSSESS